MAHWKRWCGRARRGWCGIWILGALSPKPPSPAGCVCVRLRLFPFNCTTYLQAGFGPQVLEHAKRNGRGAAGAEGAGAEAMAGSAEHAQPNCWYEPFTDPPMRRSRCAGRCRRNHRGPASGRPGVFRMADGPGRALPPAERGGQTLVLRSRTGRPPFCDGVGGHARRGASTCGRSPRAREARCPPLLEAAVEAPAAPRGSPPRRCR